MYDQYLGTTVFTSVFYILTITIGGLGNFGVIFIFFRDKPSQNNTYHFLITNMAVADLMISICFTPLLLIYRINAKTMLAEKTPLCESILLISMTATSMQYFIMALLAKNRKEVVFKTTQEVETKISSYRRNVILMWIISILSGVAMIVLAWNSLDSDDGIPKLFRCLIINQSFDNCTWFFLGYSLLLFGVALSYAMLQYKEVYKAFRMNIAGINGSPIEKSRCKMTVSLVIVYTLCWTPFIVVQFLGIFGTYSEIIFNLHAMASACGVSASAICIPFYYKMDQYYKERLTSFFISNKTE